VTASPKVFALKRCRLGPSLLVAAPSARQAWKLVYADTWLDPNSRPLVGIISETKLGSTPLLWCGCYGRIPVFPGQGARALREAIGAHICRDPRGAARRESRQRPKTDADVTDLTLWKTRRMLDERARLIHERRLADNQHTDQEEESSE
jgi:hypothetical protein